MQKEEVTNMWLDKHIHTQNGVLGSPTTPVTIRQTLETVRGCPESVQAYRDSLATEIDSKFLKESLPAVCFSGLFQGTRSKVSFIPESCSTIFLADLDKVPDIATVKLNLTSLPSCAFTFISPTGNGLKIGIVVPPFKNDAEYKQIFWSLYEMLKSDFGITLDTTGQDVSRLCFISADSDIYINENAEVLQITIKPAEMPVHAVVPTPTFTQEELVSAHAYLTGVVQASVNKLAACSEGTRNDTLNTEAFNCFGRMKQLGLWGFEDYITQSLHTCAISVGQSEHETQSAISSALGTSTVFNKPIPNLKKDSVDDIVAQFDIHEPVPGLKVAGVDVDGFIERYIFMIQENSVFDMLATPDCATMTVQAFVNFTANESYLCTSGEKPKVIKLSKAWLEHENRLSARGVQYYPGKDKLFTVRGTDWVNNFHTPIFKHDTSTDKLHVFFDHMDTLFPDKQDRDWFIQWLAYNLQFPGTRCKVTPLHISTNHGTGRGWVVKLMEKLMGDWNVKKTKMDILSGEGSAGQFQDFFFESTLCAIEEVYETGGKQFTVGDKIRDYLTEDRLEVNRKKGLKDTRDVFTNFFFMSNHTNALVLDAKDRRINVFRSDCPQWTESHINHMYSWLKGNGVSQLNTFLRELDLSNFNCYTSIHNEARETLIHGSTNDAVYLYQDVIESLPGESASLEQIRAAINLTSENMDKTNDITQAHVKKLLQNDRSLKHYPNRIMVKGKHVRLWSKRNTFDAAKFKADYEGMDTYISRQMFR